jgi:hypothetical protein
MEGYGRTWWYPEEANEALEEVQPSSEADS